MQSSSLLVVPFSDQIEEFFKFIVHSSLDSKHPYSKMLAVFRKKCLDFLRVYLRGSQAEKEKFESERLLLLSQFKDLLKEKKIFENKLGS